jgi:hypothetical protein
MEVNLSKSVIAALMILVFLVGVPVDLRAQQQQQQQQQASALQAIPFRFQPYITVQEVYDSNLFLSPNNRTHDWITTVTPGLRISQQDAFTGILLDVNGGYNWYADNDYLDYWSLLGNLEARYSPNRYWNFRVRDYAIRSEDPRERQFGGQYDQFYSTQNQNRSIYFRNVVEPSIEYLFARDSSLRVAYVNNYYDNEDPLTEDSISNAGNAILTYWFNVRNGITLDYRYEQIAYEDMTPDLTNNDIRGRYMHRLNPATSVFAEYLYQIRDYDDPGVDYVVHSPSIGIQHAFSRTLSGLLQVGYYYADPDIGDSRDGLTVNTNLSMRSELTTYTLFAIGGYREEFQTADNAGFVEYYRGGLTVSHRLLQRLTLNLGADAEWDKFIGDEEAWLYTARVGMTYQILRWMNIEAGVAYSENDSNVEGNDYTDWRGFITLTMTYGDAPRPAPAGTGGSTAPTSTGTGGRR